LEKRLLLFICLAFLVFMAWNLAFPPPKPAPPPELQETGTTVSVDGQTVVIDGKAVPTAPGVVMVDPATAGDPGIRASEEETLDLLLGGAGQPGEPDRRGAYRARFSNRGARLLSLDLADFVRVAKLDDEQRRDPANWLPLVEPIETASAQLGSLLWETRQSSKALLQESLSQVLWQMEELAGPERGVQFTYAPPGTKIVLGKKVVFEPDSWHLRVTLSIENRDAGSGRALGFLFTPSACTPAELGDSTYREPTAVAIGLPAGEKAYRSDHEGAPGLKAGGTLEVPTPLTVAGVHNKYFAFLLREAEEGRGTLGGATYEPVHEQSATPRPLIRTDVSLNLSLPSVGETRSWEYVVYAGPKEPAAFVADCPAHQLIVNDDLSVAPVAKSLLYVLRLLEPLTRNWGLAIILLTLGVRAALFPLNRRSQTAMARYQKKMKRVQPRLEEVKKRHANEPQKLREAQARIMQEEGAFPPLGGCLPIFLQMPIFFGLFSALRVSFDLRQAPFFGWIHDLSRPDRLMHLGLHVPFLPSLEYLNVLPLLMVVLWILQQMGMPKPADEQAARMQKMMMFMPVIFCVMLYNYAAGLSLYMITTSACSIIEQKVIKKLWPIDDTEQERKPARGCGPFAGIMENLAAKQREQMKRMQAMQNEQRRRQQGRRR